MSRKIFITIPMLCLSLQSTGYASALRELVELGTPLKRVMSMLRPVVPLAREYSSQIARQYTPLTSRLSAYINSPQQNSLIQRSFTTLPINRLATDISSAVPFPRILDESKRIIKTPTRRLATTSLDPLDEAIQKFRSNCNTEIAAFDPDLAYLGEQVCEVISGLKGVKQVGYPRDLDSLLSSWCWKVHDLVESNKDLTNLTKPIQKLAEMIKIFEEKKMDTFDAPYSSRIETVVLRRKS